MLHFRILFCAVIVSLFTSTLSGAAPAVHSQSYARNEQKQEGKAEAQPDKQSLASLLTCFERLPERLQRRVAEFLVGDSDDTEGASPITWRARTRRYILLTDSLLRKPLQATVDVLGEGRFALQRDEESALIVTTKNQNEPIAPPNIKRIPAQQVYINNEVSLIVRYSLDIEEPFARNMPHCTQLKMEELSKNDSEIFERIHTATTNHPSLWKLVGASPINIQHKMLLYAPSDYRLGWTAWRYPRTGLVNGEEPARTFIPSLLEQDQVSFSATSNIGAIRRRRTYALAHNLNIIASGEVDDKFTIHDVLLAGESADKQDLMVIAKSPKRIEVLHQKVTIPEEIKGSDIKLEPKLCAALDAPIDTIWCGLTTKNCAYIHATHYDSETRTQSLFHCGHFLIQDEYFSKFEKEEESFTQLIAARNEYSEPGVSIVATGVGQYNEAIAWCTAHPTDGADKGYWNLHITQPSAEDFYFLDEILSDEEEDEEETQENAEPKKRCTNN